MSWWFGIVSTVLIIPSNHWNFEIIVVQINQNNANLILWLWVLIWKITDGKSYIIQPTNSKNLILNNMYLEILNTKPITIHVPFVGPRGLLIVFTMSIMASNNWSDKITINYIDKNDVNINVLL